MKICEIYTTFHPVNELCTDFLFQKLIVCFHCLRGSNSPLLSLIVDVCLLIPCLRRQNLSSKASHEDLSYQWVSFLDPQTFSLPKRQLSCALSFWWALIFMLSLSAHQWTENRFFAVDFGDLATASRGDHLVKKRAEAVTPVHFISSLIPNRQLSICQREDHHIGWEEEGEMGIKLLKKLL